MSDDVIEVDGNRIVVTGGGRPTAEQLAALAVVIASGGGGGDAPGAATDAVPAWARAGLLEATGIGPFTSASDLAAYAFNHAS